MCLAQWLQFTLKSIVVACLCFACTISPASDDGIPTGNGNYQDLIGLLGEFPQGTLLVLGPDIEACGAVGSDRRFGRLVLRRQSQHVGRRLRIDVDERNDC